MDFGNPFKVVTPTLDGPVLRVLSRTIQPLTRRQVTDLVGDASEAGVRKVLRRLADQGLVLEERVGSQYTYVGNVVHIAWPAVEILVSAAERLDDRIRQHVQAWEVRALSVELFGSVATGTSTLDSDIDLMIYRPVLAEEHVEIWDEQVAGLRTIVERWTGNPCEVLEFDARSLVDMAADDDPILRSVRVPVCGLDMTSATPSGEVARRIRESMGRAGDGDGRIDLSWLGDVVLSPELQHTVAELGTTPLQRREGGGP